MYINASWDVNLDGSDFCYWWLAICTPEKLGKWLILIRFLKRRLALAHKTIMTCWPNFCLILMCYHIRDEYKLSRQVQLYCTFPGVSISQISRQSKSIMHQCLFRLPTPGIKTAIASWRFLSSDQWCWLFHPIRRTIPVIISSDSLLSLLAVQEVGQHSWIFNYDRHIDT